MFWSKFLTFNLGVFQQKGVDYIFTDSRAYAPFRGRNGAVPRLRVGRDSVDGVLWVFFLVEVFANLGNCGNFCLFFVWQFLKKTLQESPRCKFCNLQVDLVCDNKKPAVLNVLEQWSIAGIAEPKDGSFFCPGFGRTTRVLGWPVKQCTTSFFFFWKIHSLWSFMFGVAQ